MTNIIYHPIPDDTSFSSSSSTDHNIHSSSSHQHQLQSDQNLVSSQLNVETLSLYSVIGRVCFSCARPSPELLNDEDDSTTAIGDGFVNTEIHVNSDSNTNLSPDFCDSGIVCTIPELLNDDDNSTTAIGEGIVPITSRFFNYMEIIIATENFRECVDEYGKVMKGWIAENTAPATEFGRGLAVAVKEVHQGFYAKERWLTQARLDYLAQLHHPNLVRLVGYVGYKANEEPRCLVNEFIPNGSLDEHLFKEDSRKLSWSLLMKVALGAAKGLAFLHNAETEVIHGDFKPSNVLLDSNYNARLSDFGLAKDSPPARYVLESIEGDLQIGLRCLNGYTAPECRDSGDLTAKSDVYSFGVVLLEMLFSRRLVGDSRSLGKENIEVQKAKHCLNNKDRLFGVLNSRFEGQIALEDSQKVATLALKCLSRKANSRPTMNEVATALEMI